MGLRGAPRPLGAFVRLVTNPYHLAFVGCNVAVLLLLRHLSMRNREMTSDFMDKLQLLEEKMGAIKNLEEEDAAVRRQIDALRRLQHNDKAEEHAPAAAPELEKCSAEYLRQRRACVALDAEAVELLFKRGKPAADLAPDCPRTYHSPMARNIQGLVARLTHYVVAETAVTRVLHPDGDLLLLELAPGDLFLTMHHDAEKEEILAKVLLLHGADGLFSLAKSLKASDCFASHAHARVVAHDHASDGYLNYRNSDVTHMISAAPPLLYLSSAENSSELIAALNRDFRYSKLGPFAHLHLAANVARTLATQRTYTPTAAVHSHLISCFGGRGLHNCLNIVVDCLPELAVEQHPDLIGLLMDHYVHRGNEKKYKELLSVLNAGKHTVSLGTIKSALRASVAFNDGEGAKLLCKANVGWRNAHAAGSAETA